MFSNSPILSDFIDPIPYCHSEIGLNSILDIFYRWNCQQIAIFQKDGEWGLIDSVDLLSLITEVYLNQKLVASGGFTSSMPQQSIFGLNSHLSLIVKPAVVYRSDIRLDEFLSRLPKGSLSSDRQKYLLVDCLGELQGKLDKNRILEYLASEYKPNLVNHSHPLGRSNYFALLDCIPLPLKVETVLGEALYLNTCWQELIGDRHTQQHQLQPDRTIASWWIEQQAKTPDRSNLEKARSTKNWLSTQKHSSDKEWEDSSMLSPSHSSSELVLKNDVNSIENQQQSSFPRSKLEIEQINDWNYVKIPLTNNNQEDQLVLALEADSLSTLPKSIANKLLATVSHELKSPLTGILGLSNLLEAQKLGQLNQRQTRYVKLIHSSGQKMLGIVNDLIRLNGLTEKSSIESELINLELLCREAYQQLLNHLQPSDTKDLEFSSSQLELERSSSPTAIASKAHLSCILFHLMMEAIEVAKSPEELKVKISSRSGAIAITISSYATMSSEPDYGIDSSLRLAIVEYLTEFIQGSLKIDRYEDSCQFTLLLPIQSERISPQPATASATEETAKRNLTILCLYPEAETVSDRADRFNSLKFDLKNLLDSSKHQAKYRHRIIEADGLEQAHTLARIWQLDVIVLEGHQISNPLKYLQQLQTSEYLSNVPLITLDNKTTQAANQIKGLNVYPCLLPAEHRRVEDLMQVIQIAAGV